MPKYVVNGYLTISAFKVIEAESEDEARKKAEDLYVPSLCHQCARAGEDEADSWELNGFDDPPEDAVRHVELLEGELNEDD